MSIAGIRSNRGDGYQTLVAFDWALTVLSDPDYQWIEIDSVLYSVDDVVIGKADGSQICCQCKKNQTDFKSWTVAKLADELEKAASLLASQKNVAVRFYSRTLFSELEKLREYAITQPDETSYRANLSAEHQKVDAALKIKLKKGATNLSTYEFLQRTTFEVTPELDRMQDILYERLRSMVSNTKAAYDTLWTQIDQLGGRIDGNSLLASPQHRLTKEDLKTILQLAGAMLTLNINCEDIRSSFANTSAIGRTWQRSIAGQYINRSVVNELISAIDTGKRAILLTGLPGSGKTCTILAVQEALEQRAQTCSDLLPLFIQAREFADLATDQERKAMGLPDQWVEKAARMADAVRVIVVIDSLDVLSIAREHSILKYFLAQIDRLLLIPNITVVTACRDFDRHYDHRIAARQWDFELKCQPLDWDTEIAPLLDTLDIQTKTIDSITRELIRNPRELALFVELALREGSFNVVTSQALAQRYLDTIVRANEKLGEIAIQAIEGIADEMLKTRSLAVPHQRFTASQDIRRSLCSLNVLQETRDGKLTFGHQTLLDVLVISGAIRKGLTLNEFIEDLPPVPFVRPSIRSFVKQLAMGDRREFRRQLRAVLTGNAAFHIRRLVAESFAEEPPQNDDWSLIRDLRDKHREVFQVIYTQAAQVEWHKFWLEHLVPSLMDSQDADGLTAHALQVSRWKNEDAAGIVSFWMNVLSLDWIDGDKISWRLEHHLSEINSDNLTLINPLLEKLLSMPRQEHSSLGYALARCVTIGCINDDWLWRYIAGDINEEDIIKFRFDNKLHCQPHEFGKSNNSFLRNRMVQSTTFLDLTLKSIEQWSKIQSLRYTNKHTAYRYGFLHETSYNDSHSQHDIRHLSNERILMDATEAAILNHSQMHSEWWQSNRERLCFNREGALLYFAILACTESPQSNIDLIGRMLCDEDLLKFELVHELGALIKAAFIYLEPSLQDAVMTCILSAWKEDAIEENRHAWILRKQAELIVTIPSFLRSSEIQAVLDAYENKEGILFFQPDIRSRSGTVSAPFSFEIFLNTSDSGVLHLLAHYNEYNKNFDDRLIGGKEEVGWQLREAASRHPLRFLQLLPTYWADIPESFCNEIFEGVANYLKYHYGNWQSNDTWKPIDEPDALMLATHILDELERHPSHWHHNRAASEALQACAYVIRDTQNAGRLVFKAIGFASFHEENPIRGDSINLINQGINMTVGNTAEALMIVTSNLQESNISFPELLIPTLHRFAGNDHPAIRALILQRLPCLQSKNPDLGWNLFDRAMKDASELWQIAESCLYYSYHNHFEKIHPLLDRIYREGDGEDMETWGRISALAALSNRIDFDVWLEDLKTLDITEAWKGAVDVWTHTGNIKQHRNQCIAGLEAGLKTNCQHALVVAKKMKNIFRDCRLAISIPADLIRKCFTILENDTESKQHYFFEFGDWLNNIAQHDPELAIEATEIFLTYIKRTKPYLYDHDNDLTQLMTRLFSEAEEREESDYGEMLRRVVSIQDTLLSLGLDSINDWLRAAERP